MLSLKKIIICLLLTGCTTLNIPHDFAYTEVETDNFDFATWQKITDKSASYKVYIEGDGYAFNSHGQPTDNPTPRSTFVRELAFGDNHPNVVYMARACQFVQHKKCAVKYWTTARFATEIVDSQAEALKQIVGTSPVVLVGFSGGAQIAGLMAVRHPELNVKKIVTLAGNLDHPTWTKHHDVPPLSESLDLNDYRAAFAKIPQVHYVGTDDEIMPPFLNRNFVADKSTVFEIKNATHNGGWSSVTDIIRSE